MLMPVCPLNSGAPRPPYKNQWNYGLVQETNDWVQWIGQLFCQDVIAKLRTEILNLPPVKAIYTCEEWSTMGDVDMWALQKDGYEATRYTCEHARLTKGTIRLELTIGKRIFRYSHPINVLTWSNYTNSPNPRPFVQDYPVYKEITKGIAAIVTEHQPVKV